MSRPDADLVIRALVRRDLSSFIQRAFSTVVPGAHYKHNWHIDAIAWQLERIARGEIKRLIITIPPRSMKSIAASVAFPAWLLGHDPSLNVLAVSYGESLSEKLALDSMRVMEAPWYQSAFPGTSISRQRSARLDFATTRAGGRYSTTVGGALTGRGGDIIIIDDPHKPDEALSDVKRPKVLDWYGSTLLSRLNDPVGSAIVLIQQRVHEEDLAGHFLDLGGWDHLDLQAIAEDPCAIDLGWRGQVVREPGHLLHPERLPADLLNRYQHDLGSYVFAAQYQQRPAPLGGGLVKWEWFKPYDVAPTKRGGDQILQSWDTASKADEANDFSVCTTWHVRDGMAWLLHVYRAKLEYPDLRRRIRDLAKQWNANLVLVEEAGSGVQLVQDLKRESGLYIKGIIAKEDKATRLMSVSHLIEGGHIAIPENAPWLAEFQREVSLFPMGKHDDQVDSLSQFLNWLAKPRSAPRITVLDGPRLPYGQLSRACLRPF